jgi:DNA-directed RNA polymerase specialized sigma24 family protein
MMSTTSPWSLLSTVLKLRLRLWGGAEAREDVVQDVLVRHLVRPETPLPWVAHNVVRTENRRYAARQDRQVAVAEDDLPEERTSDEELLDREQRREILEDILHGLPPVDRQLYVLIAREQRTIRAAADALGRKRTWTEENYQRVLSRVETLLRIRVGEALRRSPR